ncbi:MAG TPA: aminoglycoside phosphotransferase family protein [Acidimicrobiia bacterium]|nr:aminoglycoside phosphotransferase family protein [Acidimicrobiia bacterium]
MPGPCPPAVTPERIGALLAAVRPGVVVDAVDVLDESSGSANRLRLRLRYRPGCDGGLPAELFLKRNLPEFTFPPEMYLTECRFYRDLAPHLSIETPEVFALTVDEAAGTFTLLMEDLRARGARLGIATDPATVDEVAGVLRTLAALHAPFWARGDLAASFPWLDSPSDSAFVRFWREAGPRLARRHLDGRHRGGVVGDRAWVHDRVWTAFDALVDDLATGPETVLHGDVHVGNTYFLPGGGGGVLDWQLMLRGNWSVDVAYLVMTALEPPVRAAHERDLLRGYLAELAALGVDPPPAEEAWRLYRANAVWGVVMWLVTPEGVHSDAVQDTSLERCLVATEELDALTLLGV